MPTTGELVLHTLAGLMSLAVLIIMGRYLLWPLFKKQPIAFGLSVVFGIAVMVLTAFWL